MFKSFNCASAGQPKAPISFANATTPTERLAFPAILTTAFLSFSTPGAIAGPDVCAETPTAVVCQGNQSAGVSYVNTGHSSLTVNNITSSTLGPVTFEQAGPVQVNVAAASSTVGDITAKSTTVTIGVDSSGSISVSNSGI